MRALALALAFAAAGCSLAPSDQVIHEFAQSDRSWCVAVNTVYGTLRMGGTGITGGKAICNQEGWNVDTRDASAGGLPTTVEPLHLRMVPAR